jgi:hypothetical protein
MSDGQEGTLQVRDFRTGGNPTLISIFTNSGFGATQFGLLGFAYGVPAGRRAIIERIDFSVNLAGTIAGGGQLFVDQTYSPSGGAGQPMKVLDLFAGDGPGTAGRVDSFGHMLAGDFIQINLTAISIGTAGNFFRTALHGIEYDV